MAPKFALFTNESKLPLNKCFQNRFLVTTVSRQALDMQDYLNLHGSEIRPFPSDEMQIGF